MKNGKIHSQMKELMGRGREAKNNPHAEALKREAEELRGKAKEAKTRGDPQWMVAHAQLKEVHRRMDEWERKKREQAYRMIRPEEKERKIEDTHVWRETRAVVRGRTAGNAVKSLDSSREEAPPGKDIRVQLGCNAFVGGVAQGVTSGVLQQHLQQFARVKYCALLTGTRNDRVRAAKVTFVTQAERIKAMVADDSVLEGRALRVRAWECRPKAKPHREEHRGTRPRVELEQAHSIPAPPGLEDYTPSTEDEGESERGGVAVRMATTGIIVPALMPVGELCTVIQGEEEFTTGKEEEKEGKRQANENKGAEPKGSAGHKKEDGKTKGKAERANKGDTGAQENKKRFTSKGDRNIGEEDEGKEKGRTRTQIEDRGRPDHRRRRERYGRGTATWRNDPDDANA